MLGLLESLGKKHEDREARMKYNKEYPFNTSSSESAKGINDSIFVYDTGLGFNVFESGDKLEMIKWFKELDEAVEFAVDHARERILNYQG